MSINEFTFSIIASLIAGIILVLIGRVSLKYWKQFLIPIGFTIFLSGTAAVVIFGVSYAVEKYQIHSETIYLQNKIDRYLKGNYPEEFKYGWRIDILKLKPKIILSFYWPKKEAEKPSYHPWNKEEIKQQIINFLKNEGHSIEYGWYLTTHAVPFK